VKRSGEIKRKTPLVRTTALSASPVARSALHATPTERRKSAKRPRFTGPSEQVVAQVAQRDEWSCVRCGGSCHGRRGLDWSVQHRRARGMGGTRREDTNAIQNLILLCGSATSPGGCHARVEARLPEDAGMGWAIKQSEDPLQVPILHWQRGLIFLWADGGYGSRPASTPNPHDAEEATL
jgi:hypothetical protein